MAIHSLSRAWWGSPEVLHEIECHWCGKTWLSRRSVCFFLAVVCATRKPDGEHFSKMGPHSDLICALLAQRNPAVTTGFDYCSPGCIAKHRRVDFEPSTCGIGKSHYGTGRWLLSLHLEALQCKLKPCPPVVQPWPTSQSV